MKKLFLAFAVIAGMSMISCGNKAADEANAEATDSAAVEVVEETVAVVDSATNDTVATDTVVAAAVAE